MGIIIIVIIILIVMAKKLVKNKYTAENNLASTITPYDDNKPKEKTTSIQDHDPYGILDRVKKQEDLNSKYKETLRKHNKLVEEIGVKYTVARELKLPNSDEMNQVVDLCLQDIALADDIIEYSKQWDIINLGVSDSPIYFDTYKRLAIIYEKQKEYQKAINICEQAIRKGVTNDGTEGGMIGRAARLTKKLNSSQTKLKSADIIKEE